MGDLIKEFMEIMKKILTNPKEIIERRKEEERMRREILKEQYNKIKEKKQD